MACSGCIDNRNANLRYCRLCGTQLTAEMLKQISDLPATADADAQLQWNRAEAQREQQEKRAIAEAEAAAKQREIEARRSKIKSQMSPAELLNLEIQEEILATLQELVRQGGAARGQRATSALGLAAGLNAIYNATAD